MRIHESFLTTLRPPKGRVQCFFFGARLFFCLPCRDNKSSTVVLREISDFNSRDALDRTTLATPIFSLKNFCMPDRPRKWLGMDRFQNCIFKGCEVHESFYGGTSAFTFKSRLIFLWCQKRIAQSQFSFTTQMNYDHF